MTETQIQITPANELYSSWMKYYDFLATGLHQTASGAWNNHMVQGDYRGAMTELCLNVFLAKCCAKGGASKHDREVCDAILKPRPYLQQFDEQIRRGYKEARLYGGERMPRILTDADNEIDQIWVDEARRIRPRIEKMFFVCARVTEIGIARDENPTKKGVMSSIYLVYFTAAQIHGLTGNAEGELDCIGHIGRELYPVIRETHRQQFPGVYS